MKFKVLECVVNPLLNHHECHCSNVSLKITFQLFPYMCIHTYISVVFFHEMIANKSFKMWYSSNI